MNFIKYTFTCDPIFCDALLEFTCRDGFDFPSGHVEMQCPCGRKMNYISIEQKEAPVEATTQYLQDQIKILQDNLKNHQNCDYWKSENGRVQSQVIDVIDEIYAGNWNDERDIANTLCQIIDYTPTRDINFTATINFTGTIQVPAAEADDFDLTSALEDAYVDINNGDVVIDNYELYDANEC